jgi:hypothetical protein
MRDEVVLYTAKLSFELEVMFVLHQGDWLMRWNPELERNLSAEEEARFAEAQVVFDERWKRWRADRAAELDEREAELFRRHWPEARR